MIASDPSSRVTAAAKLLVTSSPERVRGLALLDGVYADDWAMEAISSIQAWDPVNAHRLFAVLSIDRVGQRLAHALSVPLVKLPGAHFTPLGCPGEVVAALREFLRTFR